jgi:Na+/proline symporter
MAVAAWALILFALALIARHGGKVLEVGLSILSVAYGALLGVFLLGVLTRRTSERGAMVGMICGFTVNLYLWLGTNVPFTWYVALGSSTTFVVGYVSSWMMPRTSATHRTEELKCS